MHGWKGTFMTVLMNGFSVSFPSYYTSGWRDSHTRSATSREEIRRPRPPELIQELQETDNKESWAIEVWLDSILEGYITEFVINTNKSYNEAER